MSFCVVQTRKNKKTKPVMTVVPLSWVSGKYVYWPPSNLVTLSSDVHSTPEKSSWIRAKCKVVGSGKTYASAERVMMGLEKLTDSEDAVDMDRGTRSHPAKKKPKFETKSYQLISPLTEEPPAKLLEPQVEKSMNLAPEPSTRSYNEVLAKRTAHMNQIDPENLLTDRFEYLESPTLQTEQPSSYFEFQQQIDEHTLDQQQHAVITNPDGRQYIQLENGFYYEISTQNGNAFVDTSQEAQQPLQDTSVPAEHAANASGLEARLERLEAKIDAQNGLLENVAKFMVDFTKFMQTKQASQSEKKGPADRRGEQFDEFDNMEKIETEQQIMSLEQNLGCATFEARFFRYFQSIFKLTGKREGGPFFKTVMRKLLNPAVLLSFSWKGGSRSKKDSLPNTKKNRSFRGTFPNFVKFMLRVVSAADYEFTNEDNEKCFSDYLRQKNTEVKRFGDGSVPIRAASARKRINVKPAGDDSCDDKIQMETSIAPDQSDPYNGEGSCTLQHATCSAKDQPMPQEAKMSVLMYENQHSVDEGTPNHEDDTTLHKNDKQWVSSFTEESIVILQEIEIGDVVQENKHTDVNLSCEDESASNNNKSEPSFEEGSTHEDASSISGESKSNREGESTSDDESDESE